MRKFQNVESRVNTSRPGTATTQGAGVPRPPLPAGEEGRTSARQQNAPGHVAFGKLTRSGSAIGSQQQRPPSASHQSKLTCNNLARLNRKTNSIGCKKPVDPEVVVFTGEEVKAEAKLSKLDQTPVHKNYGKVPKYIEKYKDEAAELAKQREELKAKKKLPPGMKQMDEAERVETLEQLQSTKRELNSILQTMPISMRSENLRLKKRELEERLSEVERGITTFSRKVVYIQE